MVDDLSIHEPGWANAMRMLPAPTIGILGHYGNRNLGDEASIQSLVQGLRRHAPDARLYGFSLDPMDTAIRYTMPAYPLKRAARSAAVTAVTGLDAGELTRPSVGREPADGEPRDTRRTPRWRRRLKRLPGLRPTGRLLRAFAKGAAAVIGEIRFIRRSLPVLGDLDLLVIAGSNQLEDKFGGVRGFPYTLLKWVFMARLRGVRVCFVCVGAGRTHHAASRWMISRAVERADYIVFRDEPSRALVFGDAPRGAVCPDLAHGLARPESTAAPTDRRVPDGRVIGINPMPVFDPRYWPVADGRAYQRYVRCMAEISRRLANDGHRVIYFAMQPVDDRTIAEVRGALAPSMADATEVVQAMDVAELLAALARTDAVIATRFHGVLLSLVARRPVLAIAYERKTLDLMRGFGLGTYGVTLGNESPERLYTTVRQLLADERVLPILDRESRRCRLALEAQYDRILHTARERRARRTVQDVTA